MRVQTTGKDLNLKLVSHLKKIRDSRRRIRGRLLLCPLCSPGGKIMEVRSVGTPLKTRGLGARGSTCS